MRLLSHSVVRMLCGGLFILSSCGSTQNSEAAKTAAAQQVIATKGHILPIDTAASKVLWRGSKLIGADHSGYVPLLEGQISVQGSQISGGKITMDMKALQPTDQDLEGNTKLKAHLSSQDFFSVDSFPSASFEITKIEPGTSTSSVTPDSGKDAKAAGIQTNTTVTGNMTIKGITKSITFPAEVHADSTAVDFRAAFAIDRTNWGVNYGSENSIKDKIINKNIDFQINIKAGK
ncbi:YceI family protein [Arachidicoccus ginsenosidivorans]|uniref:YceI family protein n=1 Tax=Arachidicoccus ginsenosidivorans TaxID=496057 RepID=A0A5B8VN93_9BACT|nr:YceI family protein [Arachidicoccus ginsenosidivorans]QEC73054.1 YceI family protein [Arachidicoccus ginsenosidivorans]